MLSLPWFTWVAVWMVALFVIGFWFAVARAMLAACVAIFSASWMALCALLSKVFGAPLTSGGTAHFATRLEMKKSGVFIPSGLPLGTWQNGQTIYEPRGSHVAVIAPPRSRKSWGVIMPVLRTYRGSCIVTDLRGELYEHTAQQRAEYGPVFKFDPASPDSCCLNVLDAIRWNTPYAYGDVDRIVHHILAPTGNNIGDEFRQNGIPLLRAMIFDRHTVGQPHLPAVVEWMNDATRSINEKLDSLLHDSPDPVVQSGARRTLDMSPKLRQGVWNAVIETLGIFEDPIIREHTQTSDCYLADLLHGPVPTTIYLTMPFHEITRLGRYLGLFVECIVSLVSAPHAPARHPLLLCLDEMANLGKLTELEKAVSYLQGSGCQCVFVFQNISQILDTYGPTTPLLSGVSTHVFYTPVPTDTRTSQLVSMALGQSTVTVLSASVGDSETRTHSERERSLLTADEVTRLPKTRAVIFTQEHPPIYAYKLGSIPDPWYVRTLAYLQVHPSAAMSVCTTGLLAFCLWPLLYVQLMPDGILARVQTLVNAPVQASSSTPMQSSTLAPVASSVAATTQQELPWSLWYRQETSFGPIGPKVLTDTATRDACMQALVGGYGRQLATIKSPANVASKMFKVLREDPDHFHWSTSMGFGGRRWFETEIWCEEKRPTREAESQ
jgi:type IV secretion system protein VirD4